MLRILLLAEQPEVGRDKAYERFRELMAPRKGEANAPTMTPCHWALVLLLGKRKEAADPSESALASHPFTKYLTGYRSEVELLQSAGKNWLALCGTHSLIGLVRLSDGDRAGAREHFQKALDTRFYTHNLYPYARAYLARLKHDPEWPRWIPVKK
jgi:hypothetical protein